MDHTGPLTWTSWVLKKNSGILRKFRNFLFLIISSPSNPVWSLIWSFSNSTKAQETLLNLHGPWNGPWEANFWGPLLKKAPAGSLSGPNWSIFLIGLKTTDKLEYSAPVLSGNLSKANIQSIERVNKDVFNLIFSTNYTSYEEAVETLVENAWKSEKMICPYVLLKPTWKITNSNPGFRNVFVQKVECCIVNHRPKPEDTETLPYPT